MVCVYTCCRYFWQVWPSKVGISKPVYFLLLPSYWLSEPYANQFTLRPLYNSGPDLGKVHVQVSVNNLSFKMYENQIFALLGHNGAGKVRSIGCPFLVTMTAMWTIYSSVILACPSLLSFLSMR